MSTLSWNCGGLGNPWTVRELLGMVCKQQPNFIIIMETKFVTCQMEQVRLRMGYEGLFCVDCVRLKGGLALF